VVQVPYTTKPWWTVAQASALLRVSVDCLYDAVASGQFPAKKVGPYWRIPCEALRMTVHPSVKARTYNLPDDVMQLELPLDPACLIPVRRYRNTRELVPTVAPWGA